MNKKLIGLMCALMLLTGCTQNETEETETTQEEEIEIIFEDKTEKSVISKDDITVNETISNSEDGGHAIEADGTSEEYFNIKVEKTGDSSGDEADFYGENAAIFATDGATLNLSNIIVETDGTHANGVFSYGEGTTVNISDSVINIW